MAVSNFGNRLYATIIKPFDALIGPKIIKFVRKLFHGLSKVGPKNVQFMERNFN